MKRTTALLLSALLLGCQNPTPPSPVVEEVDLDRYLGRWYEIASIPQFFQRGCFASTARYSWRDDGRIRVENECRDGSFDGPLRRAEGVAWVVDPRESRAKLRVRFFWPTSGAYWIVALDPDYRWAMVGHPDRRYLWILSRSRQIDAALYDSLVRRAEAMGYDVSRLVRTPQPSEG